MPARRLWGAALRSATATSTLTTVRCLRTALIESRKPRLWRTPTDMRSRCGQSATVVCRTNQREVDDFLHRVVEAADWGALDHLLKLYVTKLNNQSISPEQIGQFRQYEKERAILGYGASYPIFGTPDQVARELNRIRT